ncbi:MAG: molybdopterin-dependent oxidoreductase [Acidobacteriota bacterium]
MKEISVTINGKKITATEDKTILQVVNDNNIDKIPTLCNDNRIEPYGSCFVCVVEVEGVNKLLPSCATKVTEGMVINTRSGKVMESRKTALELLLSNHYADCIGPCINNCPANVDAQGYIALISKGKNEEALKLVKQNNPLPLSIGRVCVRDCEVACRREIVDETVGINYLKRYVADIDFKHMWTPDIKEEKEGKIAVIGGGPSGLSCAYYLRLSGYKVTIFDKLPKLGGMLRYGIPEYRLPKQILDTEINWITGLGIDVKTGVEMGKDITTDSLLDDGFDAVYLAVGAQNASSMRLEFEDETEGVMKGIEFLRDLQLKDKMKLKGTVGVVGGGNTAIDAARTAVRLGAEKVMILYRRSEKEMPAHQAEIDAAREEGVEMKILTLPTKLIRDGNKLKGVECIEMELKEGEPGERPRPVPVEGSEFEIELDYLVGAIGQSVDISFNEPDNGVELEKWGTIIVNDKTMETSGKKVFAGGDVVTGPFTAITSIAHGKRASAAIDKYLEFGIAKGTPEKFFSFKHKFNDIPEHELFYAANIKKERMNEIEPSQRTNCFDEVELGFSAEQAENEVKRCLECGCSEYYNCELRKYSDEYGINIDDYVGEVRKYKVDNDHPFISLDPNKCINCGKCVRTCAEILEVSALGFVKRGFQAVVKPAMEKHLMETNCISCGNCIDVCPTGAISEKYPFKVMGTLPKEDHESICHFCSVGCRINYKVIDGDIYYVSNSTESITDSHNDGYLCTKGKFGHRYLLSGDRVKEASIKESNVKKKVSLKEALKYSVKEMKRIIGKYGPDSVAVFGSPKMSNEELYLLSKFARKGLKTNNVASFSDLTYGLEQESLDEAFGKTVSTATLNDMENSDIIVLINSGLSSENLIVEQKIKAAQKKGAELIMINSSEIKLTKFSDLWIDTRKGTNTILMNGLIREMIRSGNYTNRKEFDPLKDLVGEFSSEKVIRMTGISVNKYDTLIEKLSSANKRVIFIYNIDSRLEKSANDLKAIGNFLSLTGRAKGEGNGIVILRDYVNSTGIGDMGVSPGYLPGRIGISEENDIAELGKSWNMNLAEVFKPTDLKMKLAKGDIKAAFIFGENPFIETEGLRLLGGLEFLVVSQMFSDQTSREADVILPASSHIEQNGSFTNSDTRIQMNKKIFEPENGIENWKVIAELAEGFEKSGFRFNSSEEIFDEIKSVNRLYKGAEDNFCWNRNWNIDPAGISLYETTIDTIEPKKHSMLYSEEYFNLKIRYNLKRF